MPLSVVNPATGEVVGEAPACSREDVRAAVARARGAQPAWGARPAAERVAVVRRFQELLLEERLEVATLVTRETGKPLVESLGADVLSALDACRWVVRNAERVLRTRTLRLWNPLLLGRVSRLEHAPLGVVGVITPWNYPLAIPVGNVAFALAAGNAVVLKPASFAPLTTLRMASLFERAGLPAGCLEVVPGSGREAGDALVEADVDHLVFTGSVPVGLHVDARLAQRHVRSTMELGGSDPALVFADAPFEHAARGVLWGRFTNAGQTCAAVKRCYVERPLYDRFVAELVARASALRMGDPMDPATEIGALTDPRGVEEMEAFVEDARKRGGRVLCGGGARPDLGPRFFEPTVVVDLPPDARLLTEECFGPILPVAPFEGEEEAVRLANGTSYGLAASVWTADLPRGERVARRIEAGTVVVNDVMYTFAASETPWGGMKASGHGRTHGERGLLEMTRTRHVNVVPPARPSPWWFPYGAGLRDTFLSGAAFLYGKAGDKARLGAGLASNLARRLRR